jgi:hypothetical protein
MCTCAHPYGRVGGCCIELGGREAANLEVPTAVVLEVGVGERDESGGTEEERWGGESRRIKITH